ncbi:MAG: 1-acyl-sn-glycerol-3-phosphate acyltransferase [Candidatus Omnitrophica bacterium]|nr:1-acyl-sn-glycerol-3-phosphate acyltransferase [Candidatus Omnitrophota bacterium]
MELTRPDNWKFKFLSGTIHILLRCLYKIEIHGLNHVPERGPAILVANHQSYLDVPLVGYVLIQRKSLHGSYWVIGKTTYASPYLHWFYACCPVVVINGTVKKSEWALHQGYFVTIFPEGFHAWNRYKAKRKGIQEPELKIGTSAAILALKTGFPVIPMGLRGTEKALPPFAWIPKRGKLEVRVGEPFHFHKPEPEEVTDEMIAEKTKLIMQHIDALR